MLMSLEWFDRAAGELQDHLQSICNKYDQDGGMFMERGAKHPRIEFYVMEYEEKAYFFTLFFDPHNEEFYMETFDSEFGHVGKNILPDIEDIVDAVHEGLHDFMQEDSDFDDDFDEEEIAETVSGTSRFHSGGEGDSEFYEIDVEWETPEVTAYYQEDEVEVTYQFGIVQETGDGLLKRVNRIWTEDKDIIKDETNFMFSKEEASTIIAMIASHMDSLTSMDETL